MANATFSGGGNHGKRTLYTPRVALYTSCYSMRGDMDHSQIPVGGNVENKFDPKTDAPIILHTTQYYLAALFGMWMAYCMFH